MNGDVMEVMKAISDFRQESTEAIGRLQSDFNGHKTQIENRVLNLENKQTQTEKRQWYHSLVVLGANILHQDLGHWLNWKL